MGNLKRIISISIFLIIFPLCFIYSQEEEFKEVKMDITFTNLDSVKTIVISAFEISENNVLIPIEEVDVYLYVPRLFSNLPIGEGWLEGGRCEVEFPTNLPGNDTFGNITIIARIEDSDIYGNVEESANIGWAQPLPPAVVVKRRGLGDTDAPLWMVYTLITLMSIVWAHYLWVIYTILRLKKNKA